MAWAVRLEDVSKRFRGAGPGYASIADRFRRVATRRGRRARASRQAEPPAAGRADRGAVLALDGVSFEVEQGEAFGLVGANGAGKSTTLRLVSRISYPSAGRVRVRGRVGALIEVGSAVHLELSGRENVWLYGSILGLGRREIRERFDEIVDFAELGPAIDRPVKYYSSGMQLRLGFSIAAHLDPDVFVVDEALAVGDLNFQARCVERMTKLVREGTTLLFVSHNLPAIEALCKKAIMIDGGRVTAEGDAKDVLAHYIAHMEERRVDLGRLDQRTGTVRATAVTCHSLDGEERYRFSPDEGLEIRIRFESDLPLDRPHVVLGITDGRPGVLVEISMLDDGDAPAHVAEQWECRCVISSLPLRPRLYQVWCDVYAADGVTPYMDWMQVGAFRVVGPVGEGPKAIVNAGLAGAVVVPYHWDVRT